MRVSLSINRLAYKNPIVSATIFISLFVYCYIYNIYPEKLFPVILIGMLLSDIICWAGIDGVLKRVFGIQKYVNNLDIEHIEKNESGYVTKIYTNYGFILAGKQYIVICEKYPPSKDVKMCFYRVSLNGKRDLVDCVIMPMKRVTKENVQAELEKHLKG